MISIYSHKLLCTFSLDVEISGEIESGGNSTSDHTVVVDPDQLIGPQVIDMIMNKPGMIRWFKLCCYYNFISQ